MPALLFLQQLPQPVHQRLESAQRGDLRHFLRGEQLFRQLAQPFVRQFACIDGFGLLEPFETFAEHAVEPVEMAFVLHQRRPAEIVEVVDAVIGDTGAHRRPSGSGTR